MYRYLPPETQVVLISATLMHDVLEMSSKFMTDPLRVLVKRDELTLEGISQYFVAVEKEECVACQPKRLRRCADISVTLSTGGSSTPSATCTTR